MGDGERINRGNRRASIVVVPQLGNQCHHEKVDIGDRVATPWLDLLRASLVNNEAASRARSPWDE